jgi:hypothetical protein
MRLVNYVSVLFNTLQAKQPSQVKSGLHPMDCQLLIDSGEAFGLVSSPHTASYGGLLEIKDETTSENDLFLQELDARTAEMEWRPLNSNNTQGMGDETNRNAQAHQAVVVQGTTPEPRSGDTSARKGKRKALEILGIDSIETSPDPLNVPASAIASLPPMDKRRRLDQPHAPTESSDVSWLQNGNDLPVNHIY